MPGTPTRVTSCGSRSARARESASASEVELALAADERPTPLLEDVDAEPRPRRDRDARRRAAPPCPWPRRARPRRTRSRARVERATWARRREQPPGGAAACSRAPVFITSPATIASPSSGRAPSATSASPVLTPIRTSSSRLGSASFNSAIASWIASAARTARSGVVLVRDGRAEHADDGVADELLDRSPVALELVAEPLVIGREDRAHVLGVEALCARRRADEIGEHDRDDLPLLAPRGARRRPAPSRTPGRTSPSRRSRTRRKDTTAWAASLRLATRATPPKGEVPDRLAFWLRLPDGPRRSRGRPSSGSLIPGRPRGDEVVELRADAGVAVERPEPDGDLVAFRPFPAEQARAADRAEGLHASAVRPEDADQLLTGEQAKALARNASLRAAERARSASGSASSGSDWPKGRAPSPRSGRRRTGTSREAGFPDLDRRPSQRLVPRTASPRYRTCTLPFSTIRFGRSVFVSHVSGLVLPGFAGIPLTMSGAAAGPSPLSSTTSRLRSPTRCLVGVARERDDTAHVGSVIDDAEAVDRQMDDDVELRAAQLQLALARPVRVLAPR